MTIYVIEKVLLHTLLCGSKKKKKKQHVSKGYVQYTYY